jgi:hypothetical protein
MTVIWGLLFILFIWLLVLSFFVIRWHRRSRHSPVSVSSSGFRFSLLRFNPFSDTGGEQSFVLSLLDGGGNGILLTSLHGRGTTRFYAKRVNAGKTDQELSAEEKKALSEALNHE